MNELTYRFTTSEDIDILMQIRLEMLKIVCKLPENYEYDKDFVRCTREYFLSGEQSTVLVLDGEKAVAVATMSYIFVLPTVDHPTGKRAHLMNVYTNSDYRRKGIAAKMIAMLTSQARKKGVTEISLDATEMGRPLYEKCGYKASEECMVMTLRNEEGK